MSIPQPRFFVENIGDSQRLTIDGDESHHLLRVLRAKIGERIVVFDGRGGEHDAEVVGLGKSTLDVSILSTRNVERELPHPLVVAVSLPKGDRQKVLIEKLVELGTTTLIPLIAERSVAQPTDQALTRLKKIVIGASKQCGRNRLMKINEPLRVSDLYEHSTESPKTSIVVCDPSGAQSLRERLDHGIPDVIVIGPEGGFSESELKNARTKGIEVANLGPRVLRVETAALYAVVLIANHLEAE